MIFIDSNVPMYLVGRSHPLKSQAEELLEAAVTSGERLVTSAEVLQEILHRYVAIDRRAALHVAVMLGQGISRIMSFDADFDRVPGIVRIGRA